jgi:cytochrome c553
LLLSLLTATHSSRAEEQDSFASARLVLETRCVRCHDGEQSKGGLDLSRRAGVLQGGASGEAVIPGKPEESLLLDQVTGDRPAMPRNAPPLSTSEIKILRDWIAAGVPWPEETRLTSRTEDPSAWWAFQPLQLAPIPDVHDSAWCRSPIDRFILNALEAKPLHPSAEASRPVLLRRLCYDLTGLPPSPEEIRAFLSDPRPDAYERQVDRLLASPAYGERWGRHWLDLARYADTHGYDKDKRRDHAWPYRDWVISAFNRDTPFDRFVRSQIAGDVLTPVAADEPDGLIPTGFLAAGPWDFVGHVELGEQTTEKAKTRVLDRDDMVSAAIGVFNSLTVHCARCHDHKFDPISQRDYYALQAVFAGIDRGDVPYHDSESRSRAAQREREIQTARAELTALERDIAATRSEMLSRLKAERLRAVAEWNPSALDPPKDPSSSNGYHAAIHPQIEAEAWVEVDLGQAYPIEQIRLIPARPVDFPDTPGFGCPARWRVTARNDADPAQAVLLHEESRPDDLPHPDLPEVILVDPPRTARYVRIEANRLWKRTNDYVFALAELEVIAQGRNVALGCAVHARDSIEAGLWSTRFLVDGQDSRHKRPAENQAAFDHHALLGRIQQLDRRIRAETERAAGPELLRKRRLAAERLQSLENQPDTPAGQVYSIVRHAPRSIAVLQRGEVEHPLETAHPGALRVIPNLRAHFDDAETQPESARRAALADWLADPANVLTWRSIANRLWHYHFGRGLVDTPNDFGRMGDRPSHPELLDFLAIQLRDDIGHSLKRIHRLIVTSSTYRQSVSANPQAAAIDQENRLLWRQNRRRLESETIRDAMLAVSGTLDRRMGGPGFAVFRYQDDHSPIYDHMSAPHVLAPEGHRRAVYRFAVRSVPNPFLDCMDGADPNASVPARSTTITALQALTLLNDPFVLDQADRFARRLRAECGDDLKPCITRALEQALGRPAEPAEVATLAAFAEDQGLPAACRVIFNLNEFLFVD